MTPRAVTPCVCRFSGRSGGALGLRPRRPHAGDRVPARRVARRKALFRALVDDVVGLRDPLAFFGDRKSTRLNSSHDQISYAVFCLKKKKSKVSDRLYSRT